jgi:hypothetical protein
MAGSHKYIRFHFAAVATVDEPIRGRREEALPCVR